jgi:basic membrane lipoprotein Med (substrate-binding protein (PBP1-ABC) superfamily)
MNKKSIKSVVVFLALLTVLSLLMSACAKQPLPPSVESPDNSEDQSQPSSTEPCLTVGIIHVGAVTDAGYNQAHFDGVQEMVKNLPCIKLLEAENIAEGPDSERVMENMIQQGAKFIIPASFGFMDPALNVAAKYPEVKFEHPSGYKLAENFGTYWASSNDAFYLMGIAAAKMSKNGKIGFVAAQPISIIFSNVNGFHLGAKSINPDIVTHIVFTGSWSDPAKESSATNALIDQGVDVVSMVVDSPITVIQTAEKRGVFSIGYHSDGAAKFAPENWIGGIAFTWGPFFTRSAQSIMDGNWKSEAIMGDLNSDMIKLAEFGPKVPEDVKLLIEETKMGLINGTINSFSGPIYDQSGTLRVQEGEVIPIDQLSTIDWMVEGIIGQDK